MSDTSSADELPRNRKRRRNNMFLDADYNPRNVDPTTRARWKKKLTEFRRLKVAEEQHKSAPEDDLVILQEEQNPSTSQSSTDHFIDLNLTSENESSDVQTNTFEVEDTSSSRSRTTIENPATTVSSPTAMDESNERSSHYSSSSDFSHNSDSENLNDYEKNQDINNFPANIGLPASFEPAMSHLMMFPDAKLSTRDVSLMLMAYSIRFHLTYEARSSLFDMCKMFAGPKFEEWNTSKFVLNRLYNPPDEVIHLCFYCTDCSGPLLSPVCKQNFKNCHVKCRSCDSEYDLTTSSPNYVITISLLYQIQMLLEEKEIKNALLKGIREIKANENLSRDIRDVYDGKLYKAIQEKYSSASHLVTFNFSTDGAPVCNSGIKSFWSTQIILNELPPKLRFKYPLLIGLSINTKEPSPEFMNTYMKQFVNQCRDLRQSGINITDENGMPVTLTIVPLCCPVDSVARPILQNRLQYSGYFRCSHCYERGLYDHNAMRYPIHEDDAALRTDESHRKDYNDQESTQQPTVRGVKGFSVLLTLLSFDMVWGFPVDYMHTVLLGVVKYLWNVWVESKIITVNGIKELNERLAKMTPPHEIHRLPRNMKTKAKWKATEWRSWLLFYSIVCLKDLISPEALQHYALLVESITTLLQDSISEGELRICEEKLLVFVARCQDMYGTKIMTFNIHSLLHLVQSVRMTGPLWATSTFPFESAIFYLKVAITGPKGLYDQIAKRTLQRLTLNFTCKKFASSDICLGFCENLFAHPDCKDIIRTSNETMLLGPLGVTDDGTQLFDRCIHKSSVYHSTKYSRPIRTNDTIVELVSKEIGQIEVFEYKNDETYITLNLFDEVPSQLPVSHIKK